MLINKYELSNKSISTPSNCIDHFCQLFSHQNARSSGIKTLQNHIDHAIASGSRVILEGVATFDALVEDSLPLVHRSQLYGPEVEPPRVAVILGAVFLDDGLLFFLLLLHARQPLLLLIECL